MEDGARTRICIVFICRNVIFGSMKRYLLIVFLLCPLLLPATTLRLEGDRAWLESEGATLSEVLRLFEQRGVEVLIDPALELGRVSGEWENTKVDRLIGQLVSPNSYLLQWRKVDSPLGELYQIASIRIYSGGNPAAAQPLAKKRKVLDVVEGKDGVKYIRGEIMVGFGEGSNIDDLKALLRKLGGTVVEAIDPPGIYRIKLNDGMSVEAAMAIAKAHDGVKAAEPNLAFQQIGNESVSLSGSGAGINLHLQPGETAVAVFDSGLDPKYADLPFIRGTYNALDPSAEISDPSGHGTLTAMIASGAITPLGAEDAETGVPVLAVRTFDENGYTSSDTIMRALEYAVNSGVDIISMSWGSEVDSRFMETAMNLAAQSGIILYAAVGNENTGVPLFPAAYPVVIGVGGLTENGEVWENSNSGDFVDQYGQSKAVFNGKTYQGTSIPTPRAAWEAAQK
jgi:hypothetical protein